MGKIKDNRSVARAFANGCTESRSHNGQFYIEGDTLYSYGPHFPVARRMGDGAIWLAHYEDSPSVTTSRHITYAALELRGDVVATIYNLKDALAVRGFVALDAYKADVDKAIEAVKARMGRMRSDNRKACAQAEIDVLQDSRRAVIGYTHAFVQAFHA